MRPSRATELVLMRQSPLHDPNFQVASATPADDAKRLNVASVGEVATFPKTLTE